MVDGPARLRHVEAGAQANAVGRGVKLLHLHAGI